MSNQTKPRLLWLQSITCNGNTHSFLNHPDLFSSLSHFEVVHHPMLDSILVTPEKPNNLHKIGTLEVI